MPFSLPLLSHHVCTLAPIPPNPPACSMALFPSPNPSKFLVCTSTHHFSHCFFRLSSHFCLGSCGSPYVDKRATGAPSTPLYPCTSFHSQRISLFFVLAVFAKELFLQLFGFILAKDQKRCPSLCSFAAIMFANLPLSLPTRLHAPWPFSPPLTPLNS